MATKGSSAAITAEQHAAARHAAQNRKSVSRKSGRFDTGNLTEDLANDRKLRTPTECVRQPITADEFLAKMVPHIVKDLQREKWSTAALNLARDYMKSLASGDGSVPQDLTGQSVIIAVRSRFATTCVALRVEAGRFSGQRQDWYAPLAATAQRFLRPWEVPVRVVDTTSRSAPPLRPRKELLSA